MDSSLHGTVCMYVVLSKESINVHVLFDHLHTYTTPRLNMYINKNVEGCRDSSVQTRHGITQATPFLYNPLSTTYVISFFMHALRNSFVFLFGCTIVYHGRGCCSCKLLSDVCNQISDRRQPLLRFKGLDTMWLCAMLMC